MDVIHPALLEREKVRDVYNIIAPYFDKTRQYLWKSVKEFVGQIPKHAFVAEMGCGNGKNLIPLLKKSCYSVGIDFSIQFAKICQKQNLETLVGDNLCIPFRSESVDYVLSIAVLHHFSTHERRMRALQELLRILKVGGKMLIQVWALKQPPDAKQQFTTQDNLVRFQSPDKKMQEMRFYHVFTDTELLDLLQESGVELSIDNYFWEVGNWVAVVTKLK